MAKTIFTPPTEDECRAYFEAEGGTAAEGSKFWRYFENTDWRLSGGRGAKMKRWELAALNWMSDKFGTRQDKKAIDHSKGF